MSTPAEHFAFQRAELKRFNKQLEMMKEWGVLEKDPGYLKLLEARENAMIKLGLMKPRITTLATTISGLSPGEIKLWADAEMGWMVEARARPGASPVYKYVTDETAEKIIKREITPELERELLTPDDYLGE